MEHISKSKRIVRASRNDEGVSPVIATILMVAITVVLAAAVYYYLTGFGASQQQPANAAFGVSSIDGPGLTASSTIDDSIQIVLVKANNAIPASDIVLNVDGEIIDVSVTTVGTCPGSGWEILSNSGGSEWTAGDSMTIFKDGSAGSHTVIISVRGQVVHNQVVQTHSDPCP